MSTGSAVTGEFVSGRKLLVHVTENGHSLEFECDGATPVEAVQLSIESLCGVHVADQLLLCGNMALQPQQPLSHYKLPKDECEVFVYNKAQLLADSPCPPVEEIHIPEPAIPSAPTPSHDPHPLDDASDPALKALALYERQFRHHFQFANAIHCGTKAKLEVCKRLLREQQVQERAVAVARDNLAYTYQKLQQRYVDFVKCYSQQHQGHSDLLANFGRDLERLRSVKLHPSLQSETRKCLLDFVKENDLRNWFAVCSDSHHQFANKVSELKQSFRALNKRVEDVLSALNSPGSKDLEVAIRSSQKNLSKQKTILQYLSKDVKTVKNHVDDYLSCQLSASLRPHDAVSALGPMYDAHERNLPELQSCDRAVSELLERCKNKKNDMNLLVHVSMRNIKSVQFGIRDMMNELHAFQEVIGHQRKEFENIKFVNGVAQSYRASLAEIVRRKSFLKLYMGLAGQLSEKLATEREAETRRRDGFFKAWSKYIPHDILRSMGLFDSPSQLELNVSPFDTNLLEIDVSDVERYAPKSFVGSLSKFERSESHKSYLATYGNSQAKAEENLLDTSGKRGSEEHFEDFDSADIVGTNKMEVENARLQADLASAIALICMFNAEIGYNSLDESKLDAELITLKEKTVEALHSKDEYGKHLQSMLNMAQSQCLTYEKIIRELEQRLSDQYLQGPTRSSNKYPFEYILSAVRTDGYRSEVFGDTEAHMPFKSTVSMDEASCSSYSMDPKLDKTAVRSFKPEGGDENMSDLSATLNMQDSVGISMDSSMVEPAKEDCQVSHIDEHEATDTDRACDANREVNAMTLQVSSAVACIATVTSGDHLNLLHCGIAAEHCLDSLEVNNMDNLVTELQNALLEKSNKCDKIENDLKEAMEGIISLKRDLEISRGLLDESQMNCAHLENCLHEAREEEHTNLCAADRRASEYNALRTAAVKMHSLFERLLTCVNSVGVANFADSLRTLALSLASSVNEDGEDGSAEFQKCIKVLADKVGMLSRHRNELLDLHSRAEAAKGRLMKELEEKNELITSLYTKHQLDKQANKEKISFVRFQVHELAAFVLKSSGYYEAISRNSSNYYLSAESVALFTEHSLKRPAYIIGQIVHIERQVVRPPGSIRPKQSDQSSLPLSSDSRSKLPAVSGLNSNPYRLPVGCEYFIVTVAMLPNTIHSPPS